MSQSQCLDGVRLGYVASAEKGSGHVSKTSPLPDNYPHQPETETPLSSKASFVFRSANPEIFS